MATLARRTRVGLSRALLCWRSRCRPCHVRHARHWPRPEPARAAPAPSPARRRNVGRARGPSHARGRPAILSGPSGRGACGAARRGTPAHRLGRRRRLAEKGLVQHRAERKHVAAAVDVAAGLLLRRHVAGGPDRCPHVCDAGLLPLNPSNPEVDELDAQKLCRVACSGARAPGGPSTARRTAARFGEEDVRRLEVTMDDPRRVDRDERVAHLKSDGQ